jgi:hypothetical protein
VADNPGRRGESLFGAGDHPQSVIRVELDGWRAPGRFAETLAALALLHNRILTLRRYKDAIRKGQLLHPASYLAEDEQLVVKSFPGAGKPLELFAYPAVARTFAEAVNAAAAAAPGDVPLPTLIVLLKDELETLGRRHYREDEIRRLLKLDALRDGLAGARAAWSAEEGASA